MEVAPGIFVSSPSTDRWEPDQDVGGEVHVLCIQDDAEAGVWRHTNPPAEPVQYTMPRRETLLVLEGRARIEILDGPTLELQADDLTSIPKGAQTTRHIAAPFRMFWVFA